MPMKSKRVSFTPLTPALNNVCQDQTTAGAGNFVINGSLASGGVIPKQELAYRLDLESTGNISAVTFTITGTGPDGEAITEAIAGPNINTVTTTKYFRSISQIAVDGAVGTNTSIGTTDEFSTPSYPLDIYTPLTSIAVNISGTIDYSVQKCFERLTKSPTREEPNWVAGGLATQTADGNTAYTAPTAGVRAIANSYTGGATFAMSILQGNYY